MSTDPLTFGSVCSGIEAASVAWHPLGWQTAWVSEIDTWPVAHLKQRLLNTLNLGDMTKIQSLIADELIDAPDILVGGTPCFTANHFVLTDKGYAAIQDILPGDNVVSHRGKLCKVVRVGSKRATVGSLKGVGMPIPIITTPDHPFRSVRFASQNTRRNGAYCRVEHCDVPTWTNAEKMPGENWCALIACQVPSPEIISVKFNMRQAMYVAGMYVGDGWVREFKGRSKKAILLGLNRLKYEKLISEVGDFTHSTSRDDAAIKVTFYDTAFANWLIRHFGRTSFLKKIPAWVMSHPDKDAFLKGYLDTDGCVRGECLTINSVSYALAYGVCDLLNMSDHVASVGFVKTADSCLIEGRTVNQLDYYQVRAFSTSISRKSRIRHDMLLRKVTSYEPKGVDVVYNIEVEGDNSYIVNGAIVHNCQSFSVAGLRAGMTDPRGQLTTSFIQLADTIDAIRTANGQPESIVIWENVPGVLSSKDNAFGCFLAGLSGEDDPLIPPGGKWTNTGCVYGHKRSIAWRVLDAQYFGLAQRRKRVFLIASARSGFNPRDVLFESEGQRRDSPPSRSSGQGSSRGSASSFTASSFAGYREGVGTLRSAGGDLGGGSETLVTQTFDRQSNSVYGDAPVASTINARDYKQFTDLVVALAGNTIDRQPQNGGNGNGYDESGVMYTMTRTDVHAVNQDMSVRRLTPTECERLQGFPDGWTDIMFKGKPTPDSHRYKALGNSMAVPVMRWIGKRLQNYLITNPTDDSDSRSFQSISEL